MSGLTLNADGHQLTVKLNAIHTVTMDPALRAVLFDPCSYALDHSMERAQLMESEQARKDRMHRRKARQELDRERWASKNGMAG